MTRPDWDLYFITIAMDVASRSTCPRARVGAVIVKDNRILAAGYNGAPPDKPHCSEVGCNLANAHCTTAVHAETNAIAQAAKYGIPLEGATLYYWDSQGRYAQSIEELKAYCYNCGLLAEAAGIARVCGRGL